MDTKDKHTTHLPPNQLLFVVDNDDKVFFLLFLQVHRHFWSLEDKQRCVVRKSMLSGSMSGGHYVSSATFMRGSVPQFLGSAIDQ
jgi:hypothetical protein